jgi:hypothetical protein
METGFSLLVLFIFKKHSFRISWGIHIEWLSVYEAQFSFMQPIFFRQYLYKPLIILVVKTL